MTSRRTLTTLLGLSIVLGTVAAAPAAPTDEQRNADEARQTMRIYTDCLVKGARSGGPHQRLVAFLALPPRGPGVGQAGRSLATSDCLRMAETATTYVSRLRFQPPLLRGEAFRALYLQQSEHPDRPVVTPAEIAAGWSRDGAEMATALRHFGDCTVRIDRVHADAAIRADVGSGAETAAYGALGPALGQCVAPGPTLRFSRAVLEGVLAEALYRQANGVAAAPTPAATEAN